MVLEPGGPAIRRFRGGAVQYLQRRRAGELRDLLAWDHALYQRLDHVAVAGVGDPDFEQDAARGRRPAEDFAVHALCNGRVVRVPGVSAGAFF